MPFPTTFQNSIRGVANKRYVEKNYVIKSKFKVKSIELFSQFRFPSALGQAINLTRNRKEFVKLENWSSLKVKLRPYIPACQTRVWKLIPNFLWSVSQLCSSPGTLMQLRLLRQQCSSISPQLQLLPQRLALVGTVAKQKAAKSWMTSVNDQYVQHYFLCEPQIQTSFLRSLSAFSCSLSIFPPAISGFRNKTASRLKVGVVEVWSSALRT